MELLVKLLDVTHRGIIVSPLGYGWWTPCYLATAIESEVKSAKLSERYINLRV